MFFFVTSVAMIMNLFLEKQTHNKKIEKETIL